VKKVIILGGTGGLGREVTQLLGEKYDVYAVGSKLDITDFQALQRWFHVNQYDVVINLAGYNYDTLIHKYDEESIYEAEKQIKINALGNVNLLAACLPNMRTNGFGRVILISSVLASKPVIGTSVYSASKAFIDSLVKTTALENAGKGITCNSIQLGYFAAGMALRIPPEFQEKIKKNIPLKRFGKIEELYNTIEYLINTEYVSGTSLKINGALEF
jgi:NAD(P)-dependent dehydrogenase (short-subunit alcohol dehydrogenase family)